MFVISSQGGVMC